MTRTTLMKLSQFTGLLGTSLLIMGLSQPAVSGVEPSLCDSDDLQCVFERASDNEFCDSVQLGYGVPGGVMISTPFGSSMMIPNPQSLVPWILDSCGVS